MTLLFTMYIPWFTKSIRNKHDLFTIVILTCQCYICHFELFDEYFGTNTDVDDFFNRVSFVCDYLIIKTKNGQDFCLNMKESWSLVKNYLNPWRKKANGRMVIHIWVRDMIYLGKLQCVE